MMTLYTRNLDTCVVSYHPSWLKHCETRQWSTKLMFYVYSATNRKRMRDGALSSWSFAPGFVSTHHAVKEETRAIHGVPLSHE